MLNEFLAFWDDETQKKLLTTVIYILVYIVGGKLSSLIIDFIAKKIDEKAIHWSFAKKIIKSILFVIAVLGVASIIPGLDNFTRTLVASSTVIVASVGLASQESMANVVSGMFISVFRPFAVGDRIKIISQGLVGTIEDINLRHTIIKTIENNRLIIPNTTMNKEIIENYNFEDGRICNFLDIKISLDSDIAKAKEIIGRLILNHPSHLDARSEQDKLSNLPVANVLVRNIADEGIELRVGVWAADIGSSFRMCSDLRQSIVLEFKENDIKLFRKVIITKSENA